LGLQICLLGDSGHAINFHLPAALSALST